MLTLKAPALYSLLEYNAQPGGSKLILEEFILICSYHLWNYYPWIVYGKTKDMHWSYVGLVSNTLQFPDEIKQSISLSRKAIVQVFG